MIQALWKSLVFAAILVVTFTNPLSAKPFSLDDKMTWQDARHLLSRAGFGGAPEEIEAMAKLTYRQAVDKLVAGLRTNPFTSPPEWLNTLADEAKEMYKVVKELKNPQQRQMARQQLQQKVAKLQWELKGWWMKEMCKTDSPLTERMALFWHNHFVSSLQKCNNPILLYRQIQLFRSHTKGNFRDLVKGVAKDGAMIVYLDGQTNRKGQANENFARELMELFTLGEGHYTEQDIKEAARAFTGYAVNRFTGEFYIRPYSKDWGKKTFMGKTGYFTGEEIIDIILKKKQVSRYIAGKMWRAFISPKADAKGLEEIAKKFRRAKYSLTALVRSVLTSPHFWKKENRAVLIKSPVEMVVGTIRLFGFPVKEPVKIAQGCAYLGQNLLDPPNVKGWEGGTKWITSSTLLLRNQVITKIQTLMGISEEMMSYQRKNRKMMGKMDRKTMNKMAVQRRIIERHLHRRFDLNRFSSKREKIAYIQKVLLPRKAVTPLPRRANLMDSLGLTLRDVSYQLK